MRRLPICRNGFTLLETLLAIMLLGLVCGGLVAWLRAEVHAISNGDAIDRDGLTARWCRVLRDDLFSASDISMSEGIGGADTLVLRTCHALPGEIAGWREVVWRSGDGEHTLLRDRAGSIRAVPIAGARLELEPWAEAGSNVDIDNETTALWLVVEGQGRFFISRLPGGPEQ